MRYDVVTPDYAELVDNYTPHVESIKFLEFIKQFANESNKSALIHYIIADSIFSDKPLNVIQCSRGIGKTTMSEYAVIYGMLFGRFPGIKNELNYCLFLGDSEDNGVKQFIENVYLKITGNEQLNALINVDKKVKNELIVSVGSRKFWLVGRGAKQSPRGTRRGKLGEIRPQLLIADDVTNEDDAKSELEREEIKTRFNRAFLPALEPGSNKVILIGTPQHEDDIILTKMRNKEWNRVKLPICSTWRADLGEEEFFGAWEDRFPYGEVMNLYKQYKEDGDESGFMQEYMLELMDEADRMFPDENIVYYKFDDVKNKLDNMNIYISADFTATDSKNADYGVMLVLGVTNNNDWLILDGVFGRFKPNESIDHLFRLVSIYKPLGVGFERIAFQNWAEKWIRQEMIRRNNYFNIIELPDNQRKKKILRISSLEPRFNMQKVIFPEDHRKDLIGELVHEMKLTTRKECKARHDDAIDCLANFTQMNMVAPGKQEVYNFEKGTFEELDYNVVDPTTF